MGKVRIIAEILKEKKSSGADYWEIAEKEYKQKEAGIRSLDKNVLVSIGEMMRKTLQQEGNFVFSPVALYLAVIILAEITHGNTRKQMLEMLRIDERALVRVYEILECVVSGNTQMTTSNISSSLWINDRMAYNEKRLLQLNEKFHLSAYAGEMGTADMDLMITEWVNKTTGNLLANSMKTNTTPDTLLELLTTIYFSSLWEHAFAKEWTVSGSFYLTDGSEVKSRFMNQWIQSLYHIGTKFTAVTKSLKDGYDAIFILPNEDVSMDEVINDIEWCQLVTTGKLISTKQMEIEFSMPKYDISTKFDLREIMKSFGVEDAFDSTRADFTPISNMEDVFLKKAEQTTRFKVDEEGMEATSCVAFSAVATCLPPKLDEVKFTLNRPFIFAVVSRDAVPVFVGKVENP